MRPAHFREKFGPPPLTDDSPMPFGKYGPAPRGMGFLMRQVPASYLDYIQREDMCGRWSAVIADYIAQFCERAEIEKDMPIALAELRHKQPAHTPATVRSEERDGRVKK